MMNAELEHKLTIYELEIKHEMEVCDLKAELNRLKQHVNSRNEEVNHTSRTATYIQNEPAQNIPYNARIPVQSMQKTIYQQP